MRKIGSLFARNYDGDRLVRDEVVPGAEWVIAGEGVPTEKIDGTACLVRAGVLYKRYDAKAGKRPPLGFVPAQELPDPTTGHWPGWLVVDAAKPEDRWHAEAWARRNPAAIRDWTYELVGPKVQGNLYRLTAHELRPHGFVALSCVPTDFEGIKAWLAFVPVEGIVWWRDYDDPDCAKVKIKRRDFGLPWPARRGEGIEAGDGAD